MKLKVRARGGWLVAPVAALLIAVGCQAETPKPVTPTLAAPSTPTLAAPSPQASPTALTASRVPWEAADVLRAVLASSGVNGSTIFTPFPKSVGSQSCQINAGGPFPGIVVKGMCRTEVEASGLNYVVTFTEVWDAGQFHGQDDPSSGELRHTWSFLVSGTGAVVAQPQSGNFPPQYVR